MNTKKALISGGTGFIGSHLVRHLVQTGWDVHVVSSSDKHDLLLDVSDVITIHIHDGSTERMHEIVAAADPDIVFHLASLFLSEHTAAQVESLIRSNILFATQLVDAMAAHGVRLLVNTGTSWEHFCNSTYSPVNLYAATKQAFEAILQYYIEARALQVVTLKLFDTYGSGDPRPKLFTLLRRIAGEQTVLAMSPGEQLIDLVHVDDVVEAFVFAAERLFTGVVEGHERYAVSSGKPIRLRELVEIYKRVTGRELPIEWGERPYRPREVMVPWSDGAVLPGWSPKVGLEEGLWGME